MERDIPTIAVLDRQPIPPCVQGAGEWRVLHVKSRQEKALSDDLHARKIEHYLPLVRRPRIYGRRKTVIEVPLFPGYLFFKGTLDQAYTADRTGRVARILPVFDQSQFNQELAAIHLALSNNEPLDPYPYLKEGLRVRVRCGPLEGVEGWVESKHKRDRLIIKVEVLGQAVSTEIDGCFLELL